MTQALDIARRTLLETVLDEQPPLSRPYNSGRCPPAPTRHPDPRMHLTLADLRLPGDERFKLETKRFVLSGA